MKNYYDPPSEIDWPSTDYFSQDYVDAYKDGWQARVEGKNDSENPYELSGHERDTTHMDELNYYWGKGYNDYELMVYDFSEKERIADLLAVACQRTRDFCAMVPLERGFAIHRDNTVDFIDKSLSQYIKDKQ